ncbi:MAG: type III pantothenate kinase [Gallionella sp.]
MKLLIDAGNTRIKWAVVKQKQWLCSGVLPAEQADALALQIADHLGKLRIGLHDIQQIWVSNVAGEKIAQHIRNIDADKSASLHFVVARDRQCGVRNGYSNPSQLGSDRWAALIAAWHLVQQKCLVVNSGTATTIDALSGQGEFMGGIIAPGVELMQRSVVTATVQLKAAQGKYVAFPQNSADALYSGAIQAGCGAIERQYALLEDDNAPLILSGGAAELLQRCLDQKRFRAPLRVVDNLVLQGLLLMAQENVTESL